jgi:hypothetical protein
MAIKARAPVLGGNFGVWGGLFSTYDCTVKSIRQKEDPWKYALSLFIATLDSSEPLLISQCDNSRIFHWRFISCSRYIPLLPLSLPCVGVSPFICETEFAGIYDRC